MGLRKGLNLNLRSLARWIMLLHGDLNTFKTYLVGAFLAAVIRAGGTAVFLNIQGEAGLEVDDGEVGRVLDGQVDPAVAVVGERDL